MGSDEADQPPAGRYRPFVNVFVPFALVVAVGNVLYSELGPNAIWGQLFYPDVAAHLPSAITNLTLGRVVATILITFLFAIPALALFALYDLRTAPPVAYRYWQLFWAFAFLAYAAHAYYATVAWFDWDFEQIVARQGWPVVVVNYTLLVWWGIDVCVSVSMGQQRTWDWFYRFQWGTFLLFVGSAVTAAVVFAIRRDPAKPARSLESLILGSLIAATVLACLLARLAFGPVERHAIKE
jgi:hypothetical protein